jgi:Major intrinsic protein
MREPTLAARLGAEFLGTFVLLFGGCGSAILAAKFLTDDNVQIGIGFVGVSLAFGLSVLAGAYAFGHVSGGHFNLVCGRWRPRSGVVVHRRTDHGAATAGGTYAIITGAPSADVGIAQNPGLEISEQAAERSG